ncbi:MAG: trypsin, partial [Prosthecobacter sp.]|nr:trypsin [Prosthecobacter sp.]
MKSSAHLSRAVFLVLLFACGSGGAFGQVVNLIVIPQREATIYDYVDKLPPDKKNAIAVIEGDRGSGTGFFARFKDSVFLVTNLHVLDGNSTFKIRTSNGAEVKFAGMVAAREADIALLKLAEEPKAYFDVEISVDTTNRTGDTILVPGNSLGGGTILQTEGRIAGIGPAKIEHDAPTFHGNSGSPILNVNTWKVLGVQTLAITVNRSA